VISLDNETVFANIDPGQFIDRYIERFVQEIESESIEVHEFDKIIFAEGSDDGLPGELVWGATHDFSKHIGLLSDYSSESDAISKIKQYLQLLNATPSDTAASKFLDYIQTHYSSVSPLSEHALIEIPDPTAAKIGEYPVVDIIIYALPDGEIIKTVEATLYKASFSVDDPDSVYAHVNKKIPSGDVHTFSDKVYQETLEEFETELTFNLIEDLHQETLDEAGYTKLKEAEIPESVNLLYGGKTAAYWQKESWKVDGIDATTGFARVWFLPDKNIGVIEPTAGDFDTDTAISRIRNELQKNTN
jgi:hypothetical protein